MAQIFRVERTKNFTVMSNHHFKNKNLTLKAKGLLSLMLSLPDDWNYNMQVLATLSRGLLCADTGGYRKGTGWEMYEPGNGTYRCRTSPYLGSYTERRLSEISSPE